MGSVAAPSRTSLRAHSTSGRRYLLLAALALGAVVLVAFFLGVIERIVYAGDVMPGIRVDGVDLSAKNQQDAYTELSALAVKLEKEPLRARLGSKDVTADPSVLKVDVDELASLRAARRAGRSGNPIEQTLGTVLRRFRPDDVPLHVRYSRPGLEGILDGWQREVASGGVEGGLRFAGTQVIEVVPRRGTGLLRSEAERRIVDELHSAGRNRVTLPVGAVEPQISKAEVAHAAARARALLTGTHELRGGTAALTITGPQLAKALGTRIVEDRLDLTVDGDRLRAALGSTLTPFEQKPVDATFRVTAANTVAVVPSASGRQVDLD